MLKKYERWFGMKLPILISRLVFKVSLVNRENLAHLELRAKEGHVVSKGNRVAQDLQASLVLKAAEGLRVAEDLREAQGR